MSPWVTYFHLVSLFSSALRVLEWYFVRVSVCGRYWPNFPEGMEGCMLTAGGDNRPDSGPGHDLW